jgi:hypothetical protein
MTILDIETTKFKLKGYEAKHAEIYKTLIDMDQRHKQLEEELLLLEGRMMELRDTIQHNPPGQTFEQVRTAQEKGAK